MNNPSSPNIGSTEQANPTVVESPIIPEANIPNQVPAEDRELPKEEKVTVPAPQSSAGDTPVQEVPAPVLPATETKPKTPLNIEQVAGGPMLGGMAEADDLSNSIGVDESQG